MSRNLLPRLRSTPNPANIKAAPVGRWSTIALPSELAKIEYSEEKAGDLRTRIQSIPSPWARLHLFRNALEDPGHPARGLVENEVLDALEFLWTLGSLGGISLDLRRIRVDELRAQAEATGSVRVMDFADALTELVPRRGGGSSGESALPSLVLGLVNGRPVFASSPYTLLFTAEEAAGDETGSFFRYAWGGERRDLAKRPVPFQAYVARVLLPQLSQEPQGQRDGYVDWSAVQRLVRNWLADEVKRCVAAARSEAVRAQVSPPADPSGADWRAAAEALGLEPVDAQPIGGVLLWRRRPGAELAHSRWRLRARRGTGHMPLVIDPESFEGRYYEGAPVVKLPDLRGQDRESLPGLGIRYPWVNPATDWLTDQVLLLSEPLERENVKGFAQYRWLGAADDPRFAEPRMALPLRRDFFRYFSPGDVDRMLSVEVLANGTVAVALTLDLGSDEEPQRIVVRRTYDDASIRRDYGPGLTVWPSFRHPSWTDYVVLRTDSNTLVADHFMVEGIEAGGELVQSERVRRTPLVETIALRRAPEVLEIRSMVKGVGDRAESLGVILPRYRDPAPATQTEWQVGVDFGTSNTVVSIREGDQSAARIFGASEVTLPLTHPVADTRNLMDAYFFPDRIEPQPFGTAVVHLNNLPSLEIEDAPLGLRVTVPYSGHVDGYETNRVVGDLKWSSQRQTYYLSSSFLRHVASTVVAHALQKGVDPKQVHFFWAYPRAFTPSQVNQLRSQWERVMKTLLPIGLRPSALREETDESRSVLRHFFNAGKISTAGELKVILDVGGGTSDIAAYGQARVQILDSVMLGGRNLTGKRLQAASEELLDNPFVTAFYAWAKDHDLPESSRKVIDAYLRDGEVHLAFSYLVGTPWFSEGRAALFRAHPAFHGFQALIFYFFGALFYYLGLSFRPGDGSGLPTLPHTVVLAGNGSRYIDWLTDLIPSRGGDVFRTALGALLAAGAGVPDAERIPYVELTETPKQEVARGLVAKVDTASLDDRDAATTPVVGETLVARIGSSGEEKRYLPHSRFARGDIIDASRVHDLEWADGEMEIERFHRALVRVAGTLDGYGEQWSRLPGRYGDFFGRLDRREMQNRTEGRLEYLAQVESGFRGSVFLLEVSVMLEQMRDALFER